MSYFSRNFLSRRHFLTTCAGTIASISFLSKQAKASLPSPIKPPHLYAGAGVGLISPAGAVFLRYLSY